MGWIKDGVDFVKDSIKGGVDAVTDVFDDVLDIVDSALDDVFSIFDIDVPDDNVASDAAGILVTKTGAVNPLPVVYGRRGLGGNLVYMSTTGTDNKFLWLVYAIADGTSPANKFSSITMDDEVIVTDNALVSSKYTGFVSFEYTLGDHATQPFPALQAADTNWTPAHLLLGTVAVAFKLEWNKDVYTRIPKVVFTIEGSKVLDVNSLPTETRIYSDDPADVLFDYLTNDVYGKGLSIVDGVDIDVTSFVNSKAYFDDNIVSYSGGPSHKRMSTNLVLSTGLNLMDNTKKILQSCRGTLPFVNGKFYLTPEKHYVPADYGEASYFDFNMDNIIGGWGFKVGDINSRYNRVKATYANEDIEYKPDFIAVESSTFRTEDNNRLLEKSVGLEGVTNVYRAIDAASVIMRRSRQQMVVSFTATPEALQVQTGTIVTITHPTPGWTAKQFRVSRMKLMVSGNLSVTLTEHESTVYDLSVPNEVNTSPDTNLPDITAVPTVTGLALVSDESALIVASDGTLVPQIYAEWDETPNIFVSGYDVEYKKTADSIWLPAGSPNSVINTELYIQNAETGVEYDVRVRARNASDFSGGWDTITNHVVVGKTGNPSDVTGFTNAISKAGVRLSWTAISDLDVAGYEIREGGTSWGSGDIFLSRVDTTSYEVGVLVSGSYTFRIKAFDTGGRPSDNDATTVAVIDDPEAPVVAHAFHTSHVTLTWDVPAGTFTVVGYAISYDHPIDGLKQLGTIDTTSINFEVDWGGQATFYVAAVDASGNAGTQGSEIVNIQSPTVGQVTAEVIDNNVLLRWPDLAATLPIAKYEIRKGATYAGSQFLGDQVGTFSAIFESSAGDFTYWITGVDTAGNYGANNPITTAVSEPPDYILQDDYTDDFSGTKVNSFVDNENNLVFLANLTETWADHFNVNNSFADIQDQIDAGYPHYIQPSFHYSDTITDISTKQCTVTSTTGLSTGFKLRLAGMTADEEGIYTVASVDSGTTFTVTEAITDEATATITAVAGSSYEKTIDYGQLLENLSVVVNATTQAVDGAPQLFIKISVSNDDITYTSYPYGQTTAFVAEFRYVKVILEVTGAAGDDLLLCSNLNIVVNTKEISDSGTATITATGGTAVTFNKTFLDVKSINVSAIVDGTAGDYTAIADFEDIPNPTGMEVRLYLAGTEQSSGKVGWQIRGF
jgi:hypothetical protein